jgi:hypothetical protein
VAAEEAGLGVGGEGSRPPPALRVDRHFVLVDSNAHVLKVMFSTSAGVRPWDLQTLVSQRDARSLMTKELISSHQELIDGIFISIAEQLLASGV